MQNFQINQKYQLSNKFYISSIFNNFNFKISTNIKLNV